MGKDLFTSFVTPLKREFREADCIDDFFGIPKLNIPNNIFVPAEDYLLNNAIINYNNEVIMAKTFYAFVKKYKKLYDEEKKEDYDFWMRKFIEQTIKELYSIYDKSMHIINHLYELQVSPSYDFKKEVKLRLQQKDSKFYDKIKKIYYKLYDKNKNCVRDDITHNISRLFFRFVPVYKEDGKTSWKTEEPISIEDANNMIKNISGELKKQLDMITKKISEKYPPKGTKEYEKKKKELQEKIKIELKLNKSDK